jgi:hypothetical protein
VESLEPRFERDCRDFFSALRVMLRRRKRRLQRGVARLAEDRQRSEGGHRRSASPPLYLASEIPVSE